MLKIVYCRCVIIALLNKSFWFLVCLTSARTFFEMLPTSPVIYQAIVCLQPFSNYTAESVIVQCAPYVGCRHAVAYLGFGKGGLYHGERGSASLYGGLGAHIMCFIQYVLAAPRRALPLCRKIIEILGRRPAAPWHNYTPACWRMTFCYADEILKTLLDDWN
jgi:hypothetical protein